MSRWLDFVLVPLMVGIVSSSPLAVEAARQPVDNHEESMIRQVLEMERQAKEAALHNDTAFASRTLAEDYLAISPLGNVTTKDETIGVRREGKIHYDAIEISEMAVRVYGDTAVVTARTEVKGSDLGQDFSGPYRFTRVWIRQNGEWKAVSYQATATLKSE
jgi:ketosteroid isomerase-like protein